MRKKCGIVGCTRLGRNKGYYKGEVRYDKYCEYHHKRTVNSEYYFSKYLIDNSVCYVCGWNKAPCDRHRIDPPQGYIKGNVWILCPNCHRLVTYKYLCLSPPSTPILKLARSSESCFEK